MIARTEPRPKRLSTSALHSKFLAMLPAIRRLALIAFRDLDPEAKAEAVQEVTANAFVAFHRLAEQGKADLAYPSVLARYAICQCCTGRKVGGKLNINDVLSPYAQQRKSIQVARLDRFDQDEMAWMEILVEDKRATPADIVSTLSERYTGDQEDIEASVGEFLAELERVTSTASSVKQETPRLCGSDTQSSTVPGVE